VRGAEVGLRLEEGLRLGRDVRGAGVGLESYSAEETFCPIESAPALKKHLNSHLSAPGPLP